MDADQIEAKGDKLFDQSRHEEAKQCWDEAEKMRATALIDSQLAALKTRIDAIAERGSGR